MREHKDEKNLKRRIGSMGDGWYIDFTMTVSGKKKRVRAFGGYTKDEARNTLITLKKEKLDERQGVIKPVENVLFKDFADEFIKKYSEVNKRSADRDRYSVAHLKGFKDFEKRYLSEVSPEQVEGYKAHRRGEGVSDSTINRELSCLKTIFNKAVEWGRLESNPIARVKKFKEPDPKDRILSDDEIKRLLAAAKPHFRSILVVLLNTGMRKSEVLGLKWENVDFRKGFIYVGAADSKSGRPRTIPMSSLVFETLHALRHDAVEGYVFSKPGRKPLHDIRGSFNAACDEAKIKGVTPHTLRHTAGSKMVEAGVDLVTVSKILGHRSIQMTMRYAHPTPEAMRLAVERLSSIIDGSRQKVDMITMPKPAKDLKNYL